MSAALTLDTATGASAVVAVLRADDSAAQSTTAFLCTQAQPAREERLFDGLGYNRDGSQITPQKRIVSEFRPTDGPGFRVAAFEEKH